MNQQVPVITVDGPSGTGKGTICMLLAKKLGWHYLDSGAIYRVLALAAIEREISSDDSDALVELIKTLKIKFHLQDKKLLIFLNQRDITQAIRLEKTGHMASQISIHANVRQFLLFKLISFAKLPGLVTDGRDMGTIVFPNAYLKFFLDATPEERAKRRFLELQHLGQAVKINDLKNDIAQRDQRDRNRTVAPLRQASDAILINTTKLSIKKVFNKIYGYVQAAKFGQ